MKKNSRLLDDALVGHGVEVEESTGEMRFQLWETFSVK
jgi:hypothetical protein